MPKSQIITSSIANAAVGTNQIAANAVTSEKASGVNQGRNLIINGAMNLAQRGTSFSSIANDAYSLDRWLYYEIGDSVSDASQSTDTPNNNFKNSLKLDVQTADASVATGDLTCFLQKIEGQNVYQLGWGTSDAKTVTLSFWVKSTKTGIHSGAFKNSAQDRSYVFEYTVNASNTWEYKTITVAGDTSGTWLTTNGIGVQVTFALMAGTDFTKTAGSWGAGNNYGSDNQVNVMDSNSNEWYITGVQLEVGSTATPFEHKSYAEELTLCQRYYEVIIQGSTAGADFSSYFPWIGLCQGSKVDQINYIYDYKVQKRAPGGTAINTTVSNGYEMYNHSTQKLGNTMGTNSNNMELRRGSWWLGGSQSGIGEQSGWGFRIKSTSCFLAYECEL